MNRAYSIWHEFHVQKLIGVSYQKAVDLAEQISKLTDTFPKGTYYLKDQLNRAALSIALNIAEGNGRFHKADRRQFLGPRPNETAAEQKQVLFGGPTRSMKDWIDLRQLS